MRDERSRCKEKREEIVLLKMSQTRKIRRHELSHHDSKKITFGRIIRSKVQNFSIFLHDSNSNFRCAGINSE